MALGAGEPEFIWCLNATELENTVSEDSQERLFHEFLQQTI